MQKIHELRMLLNWMGGALEVVLCMLSGLVDGINAMDNHEICNNDVLYGPISCSNHNEVISEVCFLNYGQRHRKMDRVFSIIGLAVATRKPSRTGED